MADSVTSIFTMLDPRYLVQNTYLVGVLAVFLTMYGPRLQPKLPPTVRNLFENPVFRAVVLFLIAYLSSQNFQSSIVITVIFLVTMNLLHTDSVINNIVSEGFVINGPPVASCDAYNAKSFNLVGTPYYPLNDTNEQLEARNNDDALEYNNEVNFDKSVHSTSQK